ncbi:O-antigen ligase family protein [Paenibacillus sp. 1P07SE]|uniref:O-antigen ligase family protein n=1 Tax=Paenibacillus sp. 1P07SE TaxID=3132209 RepID=UPI0039A5EC28
MMKQRLIAAAGCAIIAALLITGVVRAGYYFDATYYQPAVLICLLAALLVALPDVLQSKEQAAVQTKPALHAAWGWLMLCPLVIAGLYLTQPLWLPVSVPAALAQGSRWGSYGAFLILVFFVLRNGGSLGAGGLSLALRLTGTILVWSGMTAWLGWLEDPRYLLITGDGQLSAFGIRAAGPVQYPNMYGALLGAYLAWHWQAMICAVKRSGLIWSVVQAVPAGAMLLLTESRGAWLAAAAAWVVGLAAAGRGRRAAWLLYPWAAFAGSALLGSSLLAVRSMTMSSAATAAGSVAAVTGAALLVLCLRAALAGSEGHLRPRVATAGGALLLAALAGLLPGAAADRLESGSYATAGARLQFYGDAWRMIREAPWLGSGGGAWRQHIGRLQSAPYVGNEVHSGYVHQLLELGWIGLALLLVLAAVLLHTLWRHNRLGVLPPVVLLLHAAVDFDMAYGLYWLLLFGFGAYALSRPADRSPPSERGRRADTPATSRAGSAGLRHRRPVRALCAALAAAVLASSALAGLQADAALTARQSALAASGDARLHALRAGLQAHPYDTRMRLALAAHAPLPERAALLAAGLRYDPQSVPLVWALGEAYAERGDVQQAAVYLRRALRRDRYDKAKQSAAVQWLAALAASHREAGRREQALAAASAGAEVYARYEMLARIVELRGEAAAGRRFVMLAEAERAAGYCRELLLSYGYA